MIIGCAMDTTFHFQLTAIFVVKPFPPSLIEGGTGVVALLSVELPKHVIPLLCVFSHSFLWHLQQEVVQNVLLFC